MISQWILNKAYQPRQDNSISSMLFCHLISDSICSYKSTFKCNKNYKRKPKLEFLFFELTMNLAIKPIITSTMKINQKISFPLPLVEGAFRFFFHRLGLNDVSLSSL